MPENPYLNHGSIQEEWKVAGSPQRRFQLAEKLALETFERGQQLTTSDLLGLGISDQILVVANTVLKPDVFQLREVDHQPVGDFVYPGKSAMIDFLAIQTRDNLTDAERDVCTERSFGKGSDRRDCVWHAPVAQIENVGWRVFYVPVRTDALHVRMVWKDHLRGSGFSYDGLTVPGFGTRSISQIWTRKRC